MPLPPPPPPRATAAITKLSVFGTPWPLAPELLRVRLKYVTARFLQMPEPRILLRNGEDILRWAQQMEDDLQFRAANELVRLALEEEPSQRSLWLYLLGCAVRDADAATFTMLARLFSATFPEDAAMEDVAYVAGVLPRDPIAAAKINAVQTWSLSALLNRDARVQRSFHESLDREISAVYRAPA